MSVFSVLNQTKKPSHSQVAEEYLKIINPESKQPVINNLTSENQVQSYIIPAFYVKKNCNNKKIIEFLINKKIQHFKKKVINEEDIQTIQNKLFGYQNTKLNRIPFSSMCNEIGEEKSMIFQNSILTQFETRTGDFDIQSYIEFLRYFSKTQYSLLHFLHIDDSFNNIITKNQLKDFITKLHL